MQQAVRNEFVNFDVESEGSPTAFTEFTGRDMICGAGLCSMQGSVDVHGVTWSGHGLLCIHIVIYIQNTTVKITAN